jgi:hypothetical protein
VAVVVVAVVGAFIFLPITRYQPNRIAALAPPGPPPGFKGKPTSSSSEPSSSSPLTAVTSAAKKSPRATGIYFTQWGGSTATADFVNALVYLLPSTADAIKAQSEAVQTYLASGSFKSNSYALGSRFAPAVPDASAALYHPTSAKARQNLAAVVQRVDNVVVITLANQTVPAPSVQANAQTVAQAEYQHLRATTPGFSLVQTRWPTIATIVYAAVAAAVVACILIIPNLVRRVRRKRRLAQEASARRQVMTRGGKIAKRQSANRR